MRNYFLIGLTALLLAASPDVASAQESDRPIVRFGVVIDGPWAGNDGVRTLFEREITELLQSEFDPRFPPELRRVEWMSPEGRFAIGRASSTLAFRPSCGGSATGPSMAYGRLLTSFSRTPRSTSFWLWDRCLHT